MIRPGELNLFAVLPGSFVNGEVTDYTVKLNTNSPMFDGDIIQFTFPPEITFKVASECTAISANLLSVLCVYKD